jgi:hypothetical protein
MIPGFSVADRNGAVAGLIVVRSQIPLDAAKIQRRLGGFPVVADEFKVGRKCS